MIKKIRKILAITSFVVFILLGYSNSGLAHSEHIFDNAEILSSSSQNLIEQRIHEFEKVTNLDLKLTTIVKLEEGNLLNNAKQLNKQYNQNGYVILIGTEVSQTINDLPPAIAVSPSVTQFKKLEKSHYDKIVNTFQEEKQTNLPNAILASIETLETQVVQQELHRQQELQRQQVLKKQQELKKQKEDWIGGLTLLGIIFTIFGILIYDVRKESSGFRRNNSNSSGSNYGFCSSGSSCSSDSSCSSGSSCGSSCGDGCGGGCGGE